MAVCCGLNGACECSTHDVLPGAGISWRCQLSADSSEGDHVDGTVSRVQQIQLEWPTSWSAGSTVCDRARDEAADNRYSPDKWLSTWLTTWQGMRQTSGTSPTKLYERPGAKGDDKRGPRGE